jgi:uncharacterized membrane protein
VKKEELHEEELKELLDDLQIYKKVILNLLGLAVLGFIVYYFSEKAGWTAHIMDWIHLIIRWAHIVLGIAWIGASFYFIFLENSLNRTNGLRDELAGNLWAIHGGGFYYIEKYKIAPQQLPEKLHWFKFEAYFTWLTGALLLLLVYYLNAGSYMIDRAVADISESTAVMIGIGTLISGWLIYDLMCRTRLLQQKKAFALIGFILLVLYAWVLSHYLSGRAAFIHIGALLGTLMVGNVFFVIIPSQKALVRAAKAGKTPNAELGKYAGLRSLHNNYMTLPVLFTMISNHFPVTFDHPWNWLILLGLTLSSVAVRHYINEHEKGNQLSYLLLIAFIGIIALVFLTAPKNETTTNKKVTFTEVAPIFTKHCTSCHSANPTDEIYKVAPNGVRLDDPEKIHAMADKIMTRAVLTQSMPQGNKTNMTVEERELIGSWIRQGAKID